MRSNYRIVGDFIKQSKLKNEEGRIDRLLGVNLDKKFMPSVANLNGVDLTKYKVIKKGQFGCKLMSVGRDKKVPISRLTNYDEAIISSAYFVFEVIDENELNPEYLMMWFSRSESDRFQWFQSGADIRGRITWEEFCSLPIKVPSIEKQRAIVKEYNTIVNRIKLNEQLNQKLEETAQALYKHWFVDFEFPNEKGQPYKSSDGKLVYNEELDQEIPDEWKVVPLSDFCEVKFSKRIFQSEYVSSGVPFYRSKEIILKKQGKSINNELYISEERYHEITEKFGAISKGDLLLTAVGTIGISYMIKDEEFYFKDGNLFWFKNFSKDSYNFFIYEWMQNDSFKEILEEITFGSTQKVITTTALYKVLLHKPSDEIILKFLKLVSPIREKIGIKRRESNNLETLKNLILSRISNI